MSPLPSLGPALATSGAAAAAVAATYLAVLLVTSALDHRARRAGPVATPQEGRHRVGGRAGGRAAAQRLRPGWARTVVAGLGASLVAAGTAGAATVPGPQPGSDPVPTPGPDEAGASDGESSGGTAGGVAVMRVVDDGAPRTWLPRADGPAPTTEAPAPAPAPGAEDPAPEPTATTAPAAPTRSTGPVDPSTSTRPTAIGPLTVAITDGPAGPGLHVVRPGDHLWSIAEEALAGRLGRPPTDAEVDPWWRTLVAANRDRLVHPDDPDLILPGQELVLPW